MLRAIGRKGEIEAPGARAENQEDPSPVQRARPAVHAPSATPCPDLEALRELLHAEPASHDDQIDYDEARKQQHRVARRIPGQRDADRTRNDEAREECGVAHARMGGRECDHEHAQRQPLKPSSG